MASKQKKHEPRREDRPGHLDPRYARALRALGGTAREDNRAFVRQTGSGDDLAEEFGEQAVVAMTTGEDGLSDDLQAEVTEERGGPFVASTAAEEFASGTDESNIEEATREPFPRTSR